MLNVHTISSEPSQKKPPQDKPNKSPEPNKEPNPSSPQNDKNRKKILDSLLCKHRHFYDHIVCSRC